MRQFVTAASVLLAVVLIGCEPPPPARPLTPVPASATPRPGDTDHSTAPTLRAAPTATSAPTGTPVPTTIPIISDNADWAPTFQSFDGVEMALVPPGCFEMGSDAEGADVDEQPISRQCFDSPFWIDRFEVTNAQFGSVGSSVEPDRPRDTVSLPEAIAHCEARGTRLPTEAEWEYAARGPSARQYPWGNVFEADSVVFAVSIERNTSSVGSRPEGASWVGALDMAGNVWEWTSTIYAPNTYPYPYDSEDGREDLSNLDLPRTIRGGSWDNEAIWMRASARKGKHPTLEWYGYVGFRCVRDG